MEFSRQEYWSWLTFQSPGDILDTEIQPGSPTLQADSLPSEPPGWPPIICNNEEKLKQPEWSYMISKLGITMFKYYTATLRYVFAVSFYTMQKCQLYHVKCF